MPVQTTTPISINDIKSGTGLSANDLGSYYRGSSTATGWTTVSGTAISYNDLRGAWSRTDRNGYHSAEERYKNTFFTTYGGYYYYYYSATQNAYYRGDVLTNTSGTTTYPGGGVTAVRGVHTGDGHATLPMGAIGDTSGVERFVAVSASCSIGGWYYYYNKKNSEMWAHQSGIGLDGNVYAVYGWVGGGIGGWINYHNSHPYGYAFGVRISTSGTAHVGKYYIGDFGPNDPPVNVTISEETAITGSSYMYGRHRQTHITGGASTEITGGVYFAFYSRFKYFKNAFAASNFNSLTDGAAFRSQGNTGWT